MVVWLSGLSGSGKTTLSKLLYKRLEQNLPNLVLLDGDDLREALNISPGFDLESRRLNSIRYARLCQLLDAQGIHVICCAVSIDPDAQAENRKKINNYIEVLVDVPLEVLRQRDPKDIYRRADEGLLQNVSGVDIPFVAPRDPHLVIYNGDEAENLDEHVDRILIHVPEDLVPS